MPDNANKTTVIAATAGSRRRGPYKAVMVKKASKGLELIWKTVEDGGDDLSAFIKKVMPQKASTDTNGSLPAGVLALDAASVAFYRIEAPPVPDSQLDPIVRMQAESLLPLPLDQMQIAWRADAEVNGKRACSIVAARSDQLSSFANGTMDRLSLILLDAEAVVRAWMDLFSGTIEKTVLINIRTTDCQVLLAEGGMLCHAVTLDFGLDSLSDDDKRSDYELFVHDLRNTIDLFSTDAAEESPVFVISADEQKHEQLISYLQSAGINAQPTVPNLQILRYGKSDGEIIGSSGIGPVTGEDICEYIEPIGLALMSLDQDAERLNLFEGLSNKADEDSKKKVTKLVKWACLLTVVTAAIFLVVAKEVDKVSLEELTSIEVTNLIEQQKMKQQIAAQRPDILGLITMIGECASEGMMLDSFDYKSGKVDISSFAKTREQIYEFEKKLNSKKDISNLKIISPTYDEKKKRVNFKMQFDYKKFSKKK
jgi:hypothetical protein